MRPPPAIGTTGWNVPSRVGSNRGTGSVGSCESAQSTAETCRSITEGSSPGWAILSA